MTIREHLEAIRDTAPSCQWPGTTGRCHATSPGACDYCVLREHAVAALRDLDNATVHGLHHRLVDDPVAAATPPERPVRDTDCDGSPDCPASVHVHGCYSESPPSGT